ncbi:MAG: endolytic transglycosylase MltG [Ignavibacteriales bacterium]|nr:endolytic transglycosylase MltG [Ignavibacteriales bacterium]
MVRLTKENARWWLPPFALLAVLFLGAYILLWLPNSFDESAGKIVTIPRGISFRAVVDSLNSSGVLRSTWTFKVAGRLLGLTKSVKVGKYLFKSGVSNTEILNDLAEGRSRMIHSVAVPEGWRMIFVARRFKNELGIDSATFMALCTDSALVRSMGFDANTLEGYLMPETYNFYWQTDEKEIIERMVESFKEFYTDSLWQRQEEVGMNLNQILTLASIVEGESSIDEERPIIAGVYWNRLKKRMRLEADPTVQYVIPDGPRRLVHRDLKYDSPYNTYLNYGLPPGPINNPGKKSILATLYPESHQYLYFVATGVGGHRFSKNFIDHQKAIRIYRRNRREAERAMRLSNGLTNPRR